MPPDGSEADYLVGSRDVRTVVEELWLAGAEAIAINGERVTPTTAIIDIGVVDAGQLRLSRAAVPGHGDRPDRPLRAAERARPGSSTSSGPGPRRYGIRLSFAEPESVDMPAFAGHRDPALLARRRPRRPTAGGDAEREPGRLSRCSARAASSTIAAVAFDPRPAGRRPAAGPGGRRRPRRAVVPGPDGPRRQPQRPQRPAPRARSRRSSASSATLDQNARTRRRRRSTSSGPTCGRVRAYAGPRSGRRARASRSRSAARSTAPASRS